MGNPMRYDYPALSPSRLAYVPRLYGHLLSSTGLTATPGAVPGSSPCGCWAYPILFPQVITGVCLKLSGALTMNANPALGRVALCLYAADPSDALQPKDIMVDRSGAEMRETFQYHDGTGGTTPSSATIHKANTKLFPRASSGYHLDLSFTTPSRRIEPGQIVWFGWQIEGTVAAGTFRAMNPDHGCADYSGTAAAFDPATVLTDNAQNITGYAVFTGANAMHGLDFLVKTMAIR